MMMRGLREEELSFFFRKTGSESDDKAVKMMDYMRTREKPPSTTMFDLLREPKRYLNNLIQSKRE